MVYRHRRTETLKWLAELESRLSNLLCNELSLVTLLCAACLLTRGHGVLALLSLAANLAENVLSVLLVADSLSLEIRGVALLLALHAFLVLCNLALPVVLLVGVADQKISKELGVEEETLGLLVLAAAASGASLGLLGDSRSSLNRFG